MVMKIVLPANTNHTVNLIPRVYPAGAIVLLLKNEVTNIEAAVTATYTTLNGLVTLSFTYTFTEGQKFQIKLTEAGVIFYRGKLLATVQAPQDYLLTEGKYYYE